MLQLIATPIKLATHLSSGGMSQPPNIRKRCRFCFHRRDFNPGLRVQIHWYTHWASKSVTKHKTCVWHFYPNNGMITKLYMVSETACSVFEDHSSVSNVSHQRSELTYESNWIAVDHRFWDLQIMCRASRHPLVSESREGGCDFLFSDPDTVSITQ